MRKSVLCVKLSLCACVCVRVVLECFGICGCRSHDVAMFSCHVRRYMRVCDALRMVAVLYECWVGCVLGRKPEHEMIT